LRERCQRARERARELDFAGPAVTHVAALCQGAGIEGVRADLAMLRAARAHAAWQGRSAIGLDDVDAVAELALAHRRRGASAGPARGGSPGGFGTPGLPGEPGAGARSVSGRPASAPPTASNDPRARASGASSRPASPASSPRAADGAGRAELCGCAPPGGEAASSDDGRCGALAPIAVRPAEAPCLPAWLARPRVSRARARSSSLVASPPRQRRARGALAHALGPIDWVGTLARAPRPALHDLRRRPRRLASATPVVIALDCSASMLGSGALRQAKGLVRALAARAGRERSPLALVSFGGVDARLELISERASISFDAALLALSAGGGTPLRRALELSIELCSGVPAAPQPPRLFLFTDGRSREAVDDLAAACRSIDLVIIDCERGPLRLGRARRVASALAGLLAHIDDLRRVERPAIAPPVVAVAPRLERRNSEL